MSARCLPWLVTLGCACAPTFPAVYGLDQLRADSVKWPGEALVHFLTRSTNDPSDCRSENLGRTDAALVDPFVAALEGTKPSAERWALCAVALLPSLPDASRLRLMERLATLTVGFAEAGDVRRLEAVHWVLTHRPREPAPPLHALRPRLERVPTTPATERLRGAIAQLLELDEGLLAGAPLTAARVESLEEEALLRRIDARSQQEDLRRTARLRIIRLHIAAATMPEVKARAAEVEAAVLANGRWNHPLSTLLPAIAQAPLTLPVTVHAQQALETGRVSFFLEEKGSRTNRLNLRPHLRFSVGWSQPLGLCDVPEALDVTPCIDARDVRLDTTFVSLSTEGVLSLPEATTAELVDLTRAGFGIVVPVELGGRRAQVLQLPVTVREPAPWFFTADTSNPGPAVNVVVVPVTQGLLVEAAAETGQRLQFVLPRSLTSFSFGSQGGRGVPGRAGSPGTNGSSGSQGSAGFCPSSPGGRGGNGGNGTPGGAGGPGGPGGDGGAVTVELLCGEPCADEALVRALFRSKGGEGGPGGPGGTGGRGGPGGQGGIGMSCYANGRTTSVSGGSPGSPGSPGADGPRGSPGAPGLDGPVQVLVR